MILERMTSPLANAVRGTELVHPDDAFDRSVAGLICGLLPVPICAPGGNSFRQSSLSSILTYNAPASLAAEKTWSFETPAGLCNAVLHKDDSITLAIVADDNKSDQILAFPLRISNEAREPQNHTQFIEEMKAWLSAAEHHVPAAWNGSSNTPDGLCAPWCDMDLGPSHAAQVLVETVYAAVKIAQPTVPGNELKVSILGRQILPDGTITAPKLKIQRQNSPFEDPEDLDLPPIRQVAELALRNLPSPESLICQEWDRMEEQGPVRLLPGVVAIRDGHASSTLTAHEQVAARDFLHEQAGLA